MEACKVLVLCQSEALFSQEYEPPAPAKATKKRKEVDESAKAFATLHWTDPTPIIDIVHWLMHRQWREEMAQRLAKKAKDAKQQKKRPAAELLL